MSCCIEHKVYYAFDTNVFMHHPEIFEGAYLAPSEIILIIPTVWNELNNLKEKYSQLATDASSSNKRQDYINIRHNLNVGFNFIVEHPQNVEWAKFAKAEVLSGLNKKENDNIIIAAARAYYDNYKVVYFVGGDNYANATATLAGLPTIKSDNFCYRGSWNELWYEQVSTQHFIKVIKEEAARQKKAAQQDVTNAQRDVDKAESKNKKKRS